MSAIIKFTSAILLAFLILHDSLCQNPVKQLHFIDPGKKSVSVHFTFINNLIIIPATINHSDTLHFIVDTGLTTSLITELAYSDSVSLNYAQKIELQGLGSGGPLSALHSVGNEITIKGIEGQNQDLYVLTQNIFHLSSKLGLQINGILGYSVFENMIVGINYDRKLLTFYNPAYFSPDKKLRKYTTLPITLHDTKPYISMTVVDEDGHVFDVKMLLDTGASHALWLNPSSLPGLVMPEKKRYSYLGSGLNGDIHGTVTRMHKIELANFDFDNVIVSFPDSTSIAHAIGLDRRNGSVGSEILKRFNLIIDYSNHQISLKKNTYYKSVFTQNLSGMEVIAPVPELHTYLVDEVRKGSPAESAGIQKDDILLYINSVPVKKLSLSEIYGILQSKPGRKIIIQYRRGDQQFKTKLILEDFI